LAVSVSDLLIIFYVFIGERRFYPQGAGLGNVSGQFRDTISPRIMRESAASQKLRISANAETIRHSSFRKNTW